MHRLLRARPRSFRKKTAPLCLLSLFATNYGEYTRRPVVVSSPVAWYSGWYFGARKEDGRVPCLASKVIVKWI
jgi:hypothetical protein